MTPDTLALLHLRFHGRHGVLPVEMAREQEFDVTVRLELPLAEAGRADDLDRTVDYRAVQGVVRAVIEGPPRKLVESLAEAIAADVLRNFPSVLAVEVEVIKLRPPVAFVSDGLAVRIRRSRPN
jgi:7,8-dihydroneopterin aldolase/epimerase/oxygenase